MTDSKQTVLSGLTRFGLNLKFCQKFIVVLLNQELVDLLCWTSYYDHIQPSLKKRFSFQFVHPVSRGLLSHDTLPWV